MKASLIIPTLNERSNITVLLEQIARAAERLPELEQLELVIVDDGSTDGTVEAIRALPVLFPIKIIERTTRGLATAVLTGFGEASHDIVGVMDADLSHPPDLIPKLLQELARADIVIGSRNMMGGAVEDWPWYRKLSSQFATVLTRPMGVAVTDPMSGFFFVKKQALADRTFSPIGYKILLEILVKGAIANVSEVPYTFRNRHYGKSKMGLRESWNYFRHILRLYRWKLFKR